MDADYYWRKRALIIAWRAAKGTIAPEQAERLVRALKMEHHA